MPKAPGSILGFNPSGKLGGHRRKKAEPLEEVFSMKHTDLTDKEVAGVIDHADLSVTKPKLAENIDATDIGFDADKVDGFNAADLYPKPWEEIERQVLDDDYQQVTISGISEDCKQLRLIAIGNSDDAAGVWLIIRFNADGGNNYTYRRINLGATYSSSYHANQSAITIWGLSLPTYSATFILDISQLSDVLIKTGRTIQAGAYTGLYLCNFGWNNSADKITRIDLWADAIGGGQKFAEGSTFILLGIK